MASKRKSTKIPNNKTKYIFACRLIIARNCDLKNRCHRCGDAIGKTNRSTTAISTYKNVAIIVQTKLIFVDYFGFSCNKQIENFEKIYKSSDEKKKPISHFQQN